MAAALRSLRAVHTLHSNLPSARILQPGEALPVNYKYPHNPRSLVCNSSNHHTIHFQLYSHDIYSYKCNMHGPPVIIRGTQTSREQHCCELRDDDTGPWNAFKAWYIFDLHSVACVFFVVIMFVWIDGHDFLTGSRSFPDNSTPYLNLHDLYQTEVNALVSLALDFIRWAAGMGTTLISWRLIEVLLETCGLSLPELLQIMGRGIPIPRFESGRQFLWSFLWS